MPWPRTLVFTAHAPPAPAASAQVLERLISGAEEHFGFVHREDDFHKQEIKADRFPVNGSFGQWLRWPALWRFEQFAWYRAAVREGLRQTERPEWDLILACHPNMAFVLAAAKVAQIRGLPLVLYLMDLFIESRVNPVEKQWARVSEKKLIKQALTVICLTEGVQKFYANKYNINPVLIPHCVTESELAEAVAHEPNLEVRSPITITYAGGVYQARLDSLVLVNQAVERLNAQGCPAKLLILGKNDPAQLNSWGIGGPYVHARFVKDRSEFMATLRFSDILLSTIAFDSDYPLQDQTCFPTKTFDYFLAGKPILVIAPGNSNYANYINRHLCAQIVESNDVNNVVMAIRSLATDFSYRRKLMKAGFAQLQEHSQTLIQPRFIDILSENKQA